jgi:hypothetical protein
MSEEISLTMPKNQVWLHSTAQQISVSSSHLDPNKSSEEFVNWISAISFDEEHHQALDQHTEGTGIWILESPEFQQWVTKEFKVLWCPGNRESYFHWYSKSRVT